MNPILRLDDTRMSPQQATRQSPNIEIDLNARDEILQDKVFEWYILCHRQSRHTSIARPLIDFRQREIRCPDFDFPVSGFLYRIAERIESCRVLLDQ